MVAPDKTFTRLAARFVCVRITDMRQVDIANLRFDFDLTFAAILMHANGHIYHRFGGRTSEDAMAWSRMPALQKLMRSTLREHAIFDRNPEAPKLAPRRTIEDVPAFSARDRKKRVSCVHCHNVHDFQIAQARSEGTWKREDLWLWPSPERVGLRLDPIDQSLVRSVASPSPAAAAGVEVGDRVRKLGGRAVGSVLDMQEILDRQPFAGGVLAIEVDRGEEPRRFELELPKAWRVTKPERYAWRSYKWNLAPAPGFGGPALRAAEKKRLGLPPDRFAFRVRYLVTWGPKAHRGRRAAKAGLRKGDVVTSLGGKSDFESSSHMHAWVRLTRKVGEVLEVRVLRKGKAMRFQLELVD